MTATLAIAPVVIVGTLVCLASVMSMMLLVGLLLAALLPWHARIAPLMMGVAAVDAVGAARGIEQA